MNRNRAILLLVIQITLVLSVAGKYLYERKTCPRVWVRTAQHDPNMPLRGRYLGLQLAMDACNLPHDKNHQLSMGPQSETWRWNVKIINQDGHLMPVEAGYSQGHLETYELTQRGNRACDRATLLTPVDYFVRDTAHSPSPLDTGQELWVEVTIPPMGPPRPIQLAISKGGAFKPLKFD